MPRRRHRQRGNQACPRTTPQRVSTQHTTTRVRPHSTTRVRPPQHHACTTTTLQRVSAHDTTHVPPRHHHSCPPTTPQRVSVHDTIRPRHHHACTSITPPRMSAYHTTLAHLRPRHPPPSPFLHTKSGCHVGDVATRRRTTSVVRCLFTQFISYEIQVPRRCWRRGNMLLLPITSCLHSQCHVINSDVATERRTTTSVVVRRLRIFCSFSYLFLT